MKKIIVITLAALFCITSFALASCDNSAAQDASKTDSEITSEDPPGSLTSSKNVGNDRKVDFSDEQNKFETNHDSSCIQDESQNSDVSQPEELKSNCKLIVNGKDISEEHYVEMHKDSKMVYIPFTAVIEALGGEVEWKSETKAIIRIFELYRIFEYTLNTEKGTFVDEWGHNDFEYEKGGRLSEGYKLKSKTVNGEYLVDDTVCEAFFSYIPAYTLVDYNDGIVRIGTDDYEKSAALIIDGKRINNEHVSINYTRKHATLPMLFVIEELGGTVEWKSDKEVYVVLGETEELIHTDFLGYYMSTQGGYGGALERKGDEILVDNGRLVLFWLKSFGWSIDVDYENRIVSIYSVE